MKPSLHAALNHKKVTLAFDRAPYCAWISYTGLRDASAAPVFN